MTSRSDPVESDHESLIALLTKKPDQTLGQFLARHRDFLKRIVKARIHVCLQSRIDASDIVQDTSIEAYSRLSEYLANPGVPLLAWLSELAIQNVRLAHRSHFITQKRSVSREQRVDKTGFPADLQRVAFSDITDPGMRFEKLERAGQLYQLIEMLSPTSQIIVRMRYLEGESLSEIAEALEMNVEAVSKRALRSLLKLSEYAQELEMFKVQ